MYLLEKVSFNDIYLIGSVIDYKLDSNNENLIITMDGGIGLSEDIIYFELEFDLTLSMIYKNNEKWPDELSKKYNLDIMIKNDWERGVYVSNESRTQELIELDPKEKFNLVKYVVVGRDRYFEIISSQNIEIRKYISPII